MTTAKFNIIIPPQDIQENPECLARIAAGDARAFEWLYKNYCKRIYDYLLLLTNDAHLSEDLVQEIFLKVWTQREKLTEIKNFNAYLYISAKNLITDGWRKRSTEKQVIKNITYTTETETSASVFNNEPTVLTKAVEALKGRQQLIYKLIREEGRTRQEISEALKLSPNTIRNTMQAALHHIRDYVMEHRE